MYNIINRGILGSVARMWWCILVFVCAEMEAMGQERVEPLDGEGLWGFYIRTGLYTQDLRDEFRDLNKGRFGKDGGLLTGVKYIIPERCSVVEEKNDGKNGAKSEAKDREKQKQNDAPSAKPNKPQRVQPLDGEGLWAFYIRTGLNTRELRDEFAIINQGRFAKDGSLLTGVYYYIPMGADPEQNNANIPVAKDQMPLKPQSTDKIEPLLGTNYERVIQTSHDLDGCVFYLVSGHGGPDPGAMAKFAGHEMSEDEYAYDVILRLGRQLLMRGATVYFIIQDNDDGIRDDAFLDNDDHETCMGKKIPLGQVKRLQQRCDAINGLIKKDKSEYKRAVFVHLDSRTAGQRIDIFLYHNAKSKMGKQMAQNIQKTLDEKYKKHQPARGFSGTVGARDLYVFKNCKADGVFLELGNLQNIQDRQRFIKVSNREAMARWIAEGIVKDRKAIKKK